MKRRVRAEPPSERQRDNHMKMLLGMNNVIVEALSIHPKLRHFFILPFTIRVWGDICKRSSSKMIQNMNGLPAGTN